MEAEDHLDRAERVERAAIGAGHGAARVSYARDAGGHGATMPRPRSGSTRALRRARWGARCGSACRPPSRGSHVTRAAVRLDDVARDGEAEARALALGREERVEDARADVLRDAAAAVVDVDDDAHPLGRDAHVDGPAVGHRLAGVAQQVEQRLAELRLVEERGRQVRLDVERRRCSRASSISGRANADDLAHRRRRRRRPPCAAAGRRATRRYSSLRCSSRCTSRWIAASRLFDLGARRRARALASSSSSSSTLRPIAESGLRISCVTCAAILPIAASRSFDSASACARDRPETIFSNAASSWPISSSLGLDLRAASRSPARDRPRALRDARERREQAAHVERHDDARRRASAPRGRRAPRCDRSSRSRAAVDSASIELRDAPRQQRAAACRRRARARRARRASRLMPSRSPLRDGGEEPLEERRVALEQLSRWRRAPPRAAGASARVASLPDGAAASASSPRASRRTSCAARPTSVSSSARVEPGLALVGDAVDERREGASARPEAARGASRRARSRARARRCRRPRAAARRCPSPSVTAKATTVIANDASTRRATVERGRSSSRARGWRGRRQAGQRLARAAPGREKATGGATGSRGRRRCRPCTRGPRNRPTRWCPSTDRTGPSSRVLLEAGVAARRGDVRPPSRSSPRLRSTRSCTCPWCRRTRRCR